ncbi:alpha-hydroxy acid oxidase [Pseudogracilibacillus auburnensis]|uniref:alpha-hydroxy acid oxidase n=1 Tax=Pseudogracilibacillus auburnensis TaxID=1494959 RepID=UPI001A97C504|nr:alpha-hydroxy acid oxidase [Pseudogracilibacillus auburnensis]MBO1001921.1 alpha-hydroxy-acid oxidizing protein [Pseudogracilibacillus auburnensis]
MTSNQNPFTQSIEATDNFPYGFAELEVAAKEKLPNPFFGYIQSGASGEETLRNNEAAFEKYALVPRFLNDVSNLDTSIELLGKTYDHPFLLAPVGMLKMADEEAELAVAKAAANYHVPFIQSTVSTYSIEEIEAAAKNSPKWFQLYWSRDEKVSYSMVNRAEKAGYDAIVLTVDTFILGFREEDKRNQFSPLKKGFGKANYETDEAFLQSLSEHTDEAVIQKIVDHLYHPHLSWNHIAELKKRTSLPILLKGILHPEDALLAIENGIDGIIVSNHGGRQLDGVIASLDALPAVAKAVSGKIPVLLDSGIRRGTDIVKALALGADAVLFGRPFVYGLALEGQRGVEKVLANLIQETNVSLTLAGATDIASAKRMKVTRI